MDGHIFTPIDGNLEYVASLNMLSRSLSLLNTLVIADALATYSVKNSAAILLVP